MVSKAIAFAVEDAAKIPQIDSWPKLRKYLIDESISHEIVDRERQPIWELYRRKSSEMPNSRLFPPQAPDFKPPPTPPMDQARGASSLSPPPCRIDNGEPGAGTAEIIHREAYIEILSNRSHEPPSCGCVFVGDCVDSYISDDLVDRLRLPLDQNRRTTLVTWRIVKTHKTIQTTCFVVPSDKLPRHDVQFGTGYKDLPRLRDEKTDTIGDNHLYSNQETSQSINHEQSVTVAGGSGFNFDILAQINVATATIVSAQLNKYSGNK